MVLDFFFNYLPPDNVPNKFTIATGKLIRSARKQSGLTQKELAEYAYIPQSTLSKMENGKIEPSASEIVYLANALNKPIIYFFPNQIIRQVESNETFRDPISELVKVASKFSDTEIRKIITQITAITEFDEKNAI